MRVPGLVLRVRTHVHLRYILNVHRYRDVHIKDKLQFTSDAIHNYFFAMRGLRRKGLYKIQIRKNRIIIAYYNRQMLESL